MKNAVLPKLNARPKIAIIGYSGSGKSTLAAFLSERFSVPILYIDTIHFLPGWQIRPSDEKLALMREFLDANHENGWVIDGNYTKLEHERRMSEADMIVFMNFNRVDCFFRAYKRSRKFRHLSRPSMTEGCDEKFDAEFRRWILWEGRSKKAVKNFRDVVRRYKDKCIVIKNQRQLDAFMKNV